MSTIQTGRSQPNKIARKLYKQITIILLPQQAHRRRFLRVAHFSEIKVQSNRRGRHAVGLDADAIRLRKTEGSEEALLGVNPGHVPSPTTATKDSIRYLLAKDATSASALLVRPLASGR